MLKTVKSNGNSFLESLSTQIPSLPTPTSSQYLTSGWSLKILLRKKYQKFFQNLQVKFTRFLTSFDVVLFHSQEYLGSSILEIHFRWLKIYHCWDSVMVNLLKWNLFELRTRPWAIGYSTNDKKTNTKQVTDQTSMAFV